MQILLVARIRVPSRPVPCWLAEPPSGPTAPPPPQDKGVNHDRLWQSRNPCPCQWNMRGHPLGALRKDFLNVSQKRCDMSVLRATAATLGCEG